MLSMLMSGSSKSLATTSFNTSSGVDLSVACTVIQILSSCMYINLFVPGFVIPLKGAFMRLIPLSVNTDISPFKTKYGCSFLCIPVEIIWPLGINISLIYSPSANVCLSGFIVLAILSWPGFSGSP